MCLCYISKYFNNTTSGLCSVMVFGSLDGICKSVGSISLMSMSVWVVIILELFDSGDGDLTLGLGSMSSFSSLRTLSTLVSGTDY